MRLFLLIKKWFQNVQQLYYEVISCSHFWVSSKIAYSFWRAEHHFVMDKLIYKPVLLVRRTDLSGSYYHISICIYIWIRSHVINMIKIVLMITSFRRCCGRIRGNVPDVYVNQFLLRFIKWRTIIRTPIFCSFETVPSVVSFLVLQSSFYFQRPLAAFISQKSVTSTFL
jgi:hypothetical protein